jgi:hypothetical protein
VGAAILIACNRISSVCDLRRALAALRNGHGYAHASATCLKYRTHR